MSVIDGRTATESYVLNTPGGSHYKIVPLLTVGDEIPLVQGNNLNNLTPVSGKTFAFAGIPDGTGLYSTDKYNYLFVNHELGGTSTSSLNSTSSEVIKGARVSLLVFDKEWKAVGGKNLIETVVDNATGTTYSLNTTTGFYTSSNGDTFSFNRFCSAYLAESGFEGGPTFFGPEESGAPGNRGWAITPDGVAQSLDGLGRYAKETIVAASQYRATNSEKTVLISTEDNGDGEVYMWVGNQTPNDPNGFKLENGDLYVLKVEGHDWETIPEGTPATATWVKVPKDIVKTDTDGSKLANFVNLTGNSTNFRRPEDIHEDPNNPGTFYFATTGRTEKVGSLTAQAANPSEADNPYGKLYRFTLNPTDPTASMQIEMVLEGGIGQGISYDNIVVDRNGNVLLQEDETAFGGDVMRAEGRDNARTWSYNIATDTVVPVFEADESIAANNTLASVGQWETSGIIEVPGQGVGNRSAYLFDVQAHSIPSSRYVQDGQLLLAVPVVPTVVGTANNDTLFGTSGNDTIDGGAGNDTIYGSEGKNILLGGLGDDTLHGGADKDELDGGEGNNTLYGGEGNNIFTAGALNDIAYAGAANDIFNLGNGNNTVYAGEGKNRVSTGLGDDIIYAGAGDDIITAGNGKNTIYAGEGLNRIATGTGNDLIYAGAGNDNINSGAGDDLIYAGEGNNTINAGIGNDTVYIGNGVNTIALNAGVGAVTVIGFNSNDKFSLGSGLTSSTALTFTQSNGDTLVSAGTDLLATLKWVQLSSVSIV